MRIEILSDSGDERGSSFPLVPDPDFLPQIRDIHVVSLRPGAVRGNHYHRERNEVLFVRWTSPWRLLWRGAAIEERRFETSGAALIYLPKLRSHTLINEGPDDLWVTAMLDGPFDPQHPDIFRDSLT